MDDKLSSSSTLTREKNFGAMDRVALSKQAVCVTFFIVISLSKMFVQGDPTHSRFQTSPPQDTIVKTGQSVTLKWRILISQKDIYRLRDISFGLATNGRITKNLITVKRGGNQSSQFIYNTTSEYSRRLRWVGETGLVAFELRNVSEADSNRYGMELSFGQLREAITDDVGLIVQYPPKILSKSPTLKQVRLPEGKSVHILCDVSSCPRSRVTWSKEGRVLQNDTKTHTLTIRHARLEESGIYKCLAKNELGSNSYRVLVIVTSCVKPVLKNQASIIDVEDEGASSDSLVSMIAPAAVFVVIFSAYFFFKCPTRDRNRKKKNNTYVNSKGTCTNDDQTTNLLAEWSRFSDRGEKI